MENINIKYNQLKQNKIKYCTFITCNDILNLIKGVHMINIKTDSRKVKKGDTFIAIKNINRDGTIISKKLLKMVLKK